MEKKYFISTEEVLNNDLNLQTKLKTILGIKKDFKCAQHGDFKGYRSDDCPKCDELVQQQKEHALKCDYVRLQKKQIGIGDRYIDVTFENSLPTNLEAKIEYEKIKNHPIDKNLLIFGKTSTGKTHLAIALLDKFLHQDFSCFYVKYYNLCSKKDNFKDVYKKCINVQFLIIDEFGFHDTDGKSNTLSEIIDERYSKNIYTCLITNLETDEIKQALTKVALVRFKHGLSVVRCVANDYRVNMNES